MKYRHDDTTYKKFDATTQHATTGTATTKKAHGAETTEDATIEQHR